MLMDFIGFPLAHLLPAAGETLRANEELLWKKMEKR